MIMSSKSGIKPPAKRLTSDSSQNALSRSNSEAAMSRSSSVSTLASVAEGRELANCTETFAVGDRVWVNGTKPGYVQFIGETQFAPGIWAGVKLDDNDGKNDGSVAGVKYFTCEPQRGLFIRPHRLTRVAGAPPGIGDSSMITSQPSRGSRTSPTNSKQGTPPRSGITSPMKPTCSRLKPGERVVVNSTGGVKFGILRYLGSTEFAVGDWAGIELDEPIGRNDGSVGGKRYFECAMKHGLFAPVHKVCRAGGTIPPRSTSHSGSFTRSYSKESLNSSTSSVASSRAGRVKLGVTSLNNQKPPKSSTAISPTQSALQEALKEKEEHIAQLLNERELERYEIAKSAVETKETRQELNKLQEELAILKQENEAKIQHLQSSCEKFQKDAKSASLSLEEEKRKMEDLQFRFEEEQILKSETESQLEKEQEKNKQLEAVLKDDKKNEEFLKRIAALEASIREKDEVVTNLQCELANIQVHLSAKEAEVNHLTSNVKETQQSLEELQTECNKAKILEDKISNLEKENQSLLDSQTNLRLQIDEMKETLKAKEANHSELQAELSSLGEVLKIKEQEVAALSGLIENEKKANQEVNENLKSLKLLESAHKEAQDNIEKLIKEKEAFLEQLASKEDLLKENSLNVDKWKSLSEEKDKEISQHKNKVIELEKQYSDEFEKTKSHCQNLEQKISALETLCAQHENDLLCKEEEAKQKQESFSSQLAELQNQKQNLENRVEELSVNLSAKDEMIAQLNSELKDAVNQIEILSKDNSESSVLLQNKIVEMKMEHEQAQKEAIVALNSANAERESMSKKLQEQENTIATTAASVAALEKILSDKDNQLLLVSSTLQEEKNNAKYMSEEICALKEQIGKLSREIQDKENHLQELTQKELANNKSLMSQLKEQENLKSSLESHVEELSAASTKKDETISQMSKKLKDAEDEIAVLSRGNSESLVLLQNKMTEMKREFEEAQTASSQKAATEIQSLMSQLKEQENLKSSLESHVKELSAASTKKDEIISQMSKKLKDAEDEIAVLSRDNSESLVLLQNKMTEMKKEFEEAQTASSQALSNACSEKECLIKTLEEQEQQLLKNRTSIEILENSISEKNNQFSELTSELRESKLAAENLVKSVEALQQTVKDLSSENEQKEMSLQQKEKTLAELTAEVAQYSVMLENNKKDNSNKQNEVQQLKAALVTKEAQITELGSMVEASQKQLVLLMQQNENNLALMESRIGSFKEEQDKHLREKENVLQTEIEKLHGEVEEKNKVLERSLSQITEWQAQVQQRDDSIQQLKQQLKDQEEKMHSTLQNRQAIEEFESRILSLQSLCEKLEKEKKEIEKKEHATREAHQALEKAKDILIHDKKEQEALVKDRDAKLQMLQQEVTRMQSQFMQHKDELEGKLDVSQMELEAMKEFKQELEMQQGVIEELQKQLQDAENSKLSLEESLKNVPDINELQAQMTDLKKELLIASNSTQEESERRRNLENQLRSQQQSLKEKDSEISVLKSIQATSKDTETLAAKLKIVEAEKQDLMNEIAKLKAEKSNKNNSPAATSDEEDEKEALKSQVDFLNSIIVEMQRKNEELKKKQDGFSDLSDPDLNFNGVRQIPPRLFCDICDMFDLHDTDDCPKQSSFSEDIPHSRHGGSRHEERPYCNNCEVFGHWTLDCDDQQTF